MYAIYIYKKPLHIFVLGLKLYRKVKKIKKKEEAINSSIVEYVFFFFNKSLSRVSSAYDHNV
jgi:hypothetical protein